MMNQDEFESKVDDFLKIVYNIALTPVKIGFVGVFATIRFRDVYWKRDWVITVSCDPVKNELFLRRLIDPRKFECSEAGLYACLWHEANDRLEAQLETIAQCRLMHHD